MRFKLRSTPQGIVAAIAIVLCLAVAGCSAEVNVDEGPGMSGEEIAKEIRKIYADNTDSELTRLTCESVEAKVGAKFSCSGRNAKDVLLEIDGKVTDTFADDLNYSWSVTKAIALPAFYERALRRSIEEDGIALSKVRCPVEVEIKVGSKLRCTATDRTGSSRSVTLQLTDPEGGFDYTVEEEGPVEESPAP